MLNELHPVIDQNQLKQILMLNMFYLLCTKKNNSLFFCSDALDELSDEKRLAQFVIFIEVLWINI